MKDNFLDGINLDIELYCPPGSPLRAALLALTKETRAALDAYHPGLQLTWDVPNMPNYYQHYYDYAGMAQYSDFFFIMDYDETHWFGAYANSPYPQTVLGVQQFEKIGNI